MGQVFSKIKKSFSNRPKDTVMDRAWEKRTPILSDLADRLKLPFPGKSRIVVDPKDAAIVKEMKRAHPNVPGFVFDYAPVVWLDENEKYFPSDISAQVSNSTPMINFAPVTGYDKPLTLSNLDKLNGHGGESVYLTSNDDITKNPPWLEGIRPNASGKTENGITCAIVIRDHADTPGDTSGLIDVFYFYFYAFNQGNRVLGREYGDHVGDWENVMVRFSTKSSKVTSSKPKPESLWLSQHSLGQGFYYQVIQKKPNTRRPLVYSSQGSHANYAIAGDHDHAIPNFNLPVGFVEDHTSEGFLWDPAQSTYVYKYDSSKKSFSSFNNPDPVAYLHFEGRWGDDQYPESDPRQVETFGASKLAKYVRGPTGPKFKGLARKEIWPDGKESFVRHILVP